MIVINRNCRSIVRSVLLLGVVAGAACDNGNTAPRGGTVSIKLNPCTPSGTLTLAVATAALTDCSAGGTTLTLAGGGASYLIFPQFPTETAADNFVDYQLFTGPVSSGTSMSMRRLSAARLQTAPRGGIPSSTEFRGRNMTAQFTAERLLRARAARNAGSTTISASRSRQLSATQSRITVPPVGSTRQFFVASSFTTNSYATIGAKLAYVGANVLVYIDTLAPANGFTPVQLTTFGTLFDSTLYPIDTTAFGSPSDIDANGHAIMLMTPVVNADTPTSTCQTQGFVGGFFDTNDFNAQSPTSNNGEIFYSIVPDPNAAFSCAHTVADVGSVVPSTFMHELQHLINYSQHVVISHGQPSSSWLDEGMSILAEELGSLYYENKFPPPQGRTDPSQIFPDSSQGFVQDFLYDSYQYALLPDTASIMLSDDSENGFSWRGGAWLFARWLGDHYGSTVFKQLETGNSDAVINVQNATGQPFTTLFANFGLALYTDSLPGLPRATAPLLNRFVSRNVSQLWNRLFVTSGGAPDVPFARPIFLAQINNDTSSSIALPGTMTFWQLNTLASDTTVTIQYSPPGGVAFPAVLHSQIAVFRLP
jgi:hypothetical protein